MSVLVTWNGSQYILPTAGETGWGTSVTNFLTDVANNGVSLTGTQTLQNKAIQLQAGSVGAPSLSFQTDTNTGLYLVGADQVGIATGGVQRVLVDASGNVTANGSLTLAGNLTMTSGNLTLAPNATFPATVTNVGRNMLHNSMFRVQQRGTGAWTTTGAYTADRWFMGLGTGGGSMSVAIGPLGDTGRAAMGEEDGNSYLACAVVGGAAAGDIHTIRQRIENVRKLAGKTLTHPLIFLGT